MTATRLKVGSARYYVTCPDSDDIDTRSCGRRTHRVARFCRTTTVASGYSCGPGGRMFGMHTPDAHFGACSRCPFKVARHTPTVQHLNPGSRWANAMGQTP